MSERHYTILSTASIPFDRIPEIPISVNLQVIPFIEIVIREDESLKKQARNLAKEKKTAVFTSAHAVRWIKKELIEKPDWKIYCTRYETRREIAEWVGEPNDIKIADNARALSELILADGIRDVVFFCGDQRMDILPDYLKKHGVHLTELIVYDTRLTPVQITICPDAVLFFSPTAVNSFFSLNVLTPSTTIFAMGHTTAASLKKYTRLPVIVSPESDKSFVVNMALANAGIHPVI
jgi:uroporphyrinogen-III synthase